jgi:hypothetical protein
MDEELMRQALAGEEVATKIYCGSYMLVKNKETKQLYRHKGETAPEGFTEILYWDGPVYDKDGFLAMRFWSLPRTNE